MSDPRRTQKPDLKKDTEQKPASEKEPELDEATRQAMVEHQAAQKKRLEETKAATMAQQKTDLAEAETQLNELYAERMGMSSPIDAPNPHDTTTPVLDTRDTAVAAQFETSDPFAAAERQAALATPEQVAAGQAALREALAEARARDAREANEERERTPIFARGDLTQKEIALGEEIAAYIKATNKRMETPEELAKAEARRALPLSPEVIAIHQAALAREKAEENAREEVKSAERAKKEIKEKGEAAERAAAELVRQKALEEQRKKNEAVQKASEEYEKHKGTLVTPPEKLTQDDIALGEKIAKTNKELGKKYDRMALEKAAAEAAKGIPTAAEAAKGIPTEEEDIAAYNKMLAEKRARKALKQAAAEAAKNIPTDGKEIDPEIEVGTVTDEEADEVIDANEPEEEVTDDMIINRTSPEEARAMSEETADAIQMMKETHLETMAEETAAAEDSARDMAVDLQRLRELGAEVTQEHAAGQTEKKNEAPQENPTSLPNVAETQRNEKNTDNTTRESAPIAAPPKPSVLKRVTGLFDKLFRKE